MDSGEALSLLLFILKTIIFYNVFLYRYIITCCRTVVFPKLLHFSFCILVVKGAGRHGMWRQVIVQWISVGVTESDCSLYDSPVPPNTYMGGGPMEASEKPGKPLLTIILLGPKYLPNGCSTRLCCVIPLSLSIKSKCTPPLTVGKLRVRHDTCLMPNKFCRNVLSALVVLVRMVWFFVIAVRVLKERRDRVLVFVIFLARVLNPHRMSLTSVSADAMNVLDKCFR
jgi:hypothetical protein